MSRSGSLDGRVQSRVIDAAQISPPVYGDEQEQPDHVNEVPVPGGGFKSEMAFGRELALFRTYPANKQEHRAYEYVETMEAGCHEESRWIYAVSKFEMRVHVFKNLEKQEYDAETNCNG